MKQQDCTKKNEVKYIYNYEDRKNHNTSNVKVWSS